MAATALRIAVCVKQVLDPELPADTFALDASGRAPVVRGRPATRVLDPYAANALEAALRLREAGAAHVTAICVGEAGSDDALRSAFALTADAALRAWDDGWQELDGLAVAHVLARAIERVGSIDLVLCGREAGDVEESVVGPALAEELGLPCVALARRIECRPGAVRVEREIDGRAETLEAPLPAVVTLGSSAWNVPRMATNRDTMLARMKKIQVCGAQELGVDPERVRFGVRLEGLSLIGVERDCELVSGDEAGAAELARRIATRVSL